MRQTALQYANAGALLAQMYRQQNQRESAVSVWRECFELAFRLAYALPIAKANVGIELALDLGQSALSSDRIEAYAIFKRTLRTYQSLLEGVPPQDASEKTLPPADRRMVIRDRIVSALRSAHQVCRAINEPGLELISARGALRASEQFWGSSDFRTASVRADFAECLSRRGRKEVALLLYLKNIEVLPDANTSGDPKILLYFARVAELSFETGRWTEAGEVAAQTLRRISRIDKPEESAQIRAVLHKTLGDCSFRFKALEHLTLARAHYESAVAFAQQGEYVDLTFLVEALGCSSRAIMSQAALVSSEVEFHALAKEAHKRHENVFELIEQVPGGGGTLAVIAHQDYFDFLCESGRVDDALNEALLLIKMSASEWGEASTQHLLTLHQRAEAFASIAQFGHAEALYRGKAFENLFFVQMETPLASFLKSASFKDTKFARTALLQMPTMQPS